MRELKYIATSIIAIITATIWIVFVFWVVGLEIFERGLMGLVTFANGVIFAVYDYTKTTG